MTTQTPSTPSNSQRWFQVTVVALLAVMVGIVAYFVFSDDGTETTETPVSTSVATTAVTESTEVATTSEEVTTTETTPVTEPVTEPPTTTDNPELYATAVWPLVTMSIRYDTPEAAVQGFAEGFAGFTDPMISEFMQGDSRSGEFEIRPTTDGPVTVVFVRQLGPDDSWWILGSVAENIAVSEPPAFESVVSPLVVAGEASAFEGTVQTELRADGTDDLLIDSFVTGGSTGLGPFTETFTFDSPGEGFGALVFLIRSAEDGSVTEVTALRVSFAAS